MATEATWRIGRFEVTSIDESTRSSGQSPHDDMYEYTLESVSSEDALDDADEIVYADIVFGPKIGQGNFGEVFKAELYGQDVAVKKLRMKRTRIGYMRAFLREVEIMRSLRHPNIVEFMGVCIRKPNICIVTEYLDRGSLHDLLKARRSPLPWKRYFQLAQDIARGLNWLHFKGIIHRDLKPSNLLVSKYNKVKLADFGLSHVKRSPYSYSGVYGVCGTPCYMAPEVLLELPYSFKADVFSLGMVLCQMITGQYPFRQGGRVHEVDYQHEIIVGNRPVIPRDAPEPLVELIAQCWQTDPDDRPTAAQVLLALARVEEHMNDVQYALSEASELGIPEEVRDVLAEQQLRMKEMTAAIADCHSDIADVADTVRGNELELAKMQRRRAELDTKLRSLEEDHRALQVQEEQAAQQLLAARRRALCSHRPVLLKRQSFT